jgi:hypothetical protein
MCICGSGLIGYTYKEINFHVEEKLVGWFNLQINNIKLRVLKHKIYSIL